jgi:hypothetical protein
LKDGLGTLADVLSYSIDLQEHFNEVRASTELDISHLTISNTIESTARALLWLFSLKTLETDGRGWAKFGGFAGASVLGRIIFLFFHRLSRTEGSLTRIPKRKFSMPL